MIHDVDADGSGTVEFSEFAALMKKLDDGGDDTEALKEAFDAFDTDGNGFISISELGKLMENLGAKMTDAELQLVLKDADHDGDGQINFDEFCKLMGDV